LVLSCAEEAFSGYISPHPRPADLAIGPLFIANGKRLATASPAGYGNRGLYKIPFVLLAGSAATVRIAAPARLHVMIVVSGYHVGGVAAVSYHACPRRTGFFPQYFAFSHGQVHGCVPLDVTIGGRPRVHHIVLSLFAGTCPSQHPDPA
jgi:hypothetical protein